MFINRICAVVLTCFMLNGCTGIPEGVAPVKDFDIKQYLGKWYEIARLDHSFERDLTHVTATYELRQDGGINVINRGYNTVDNNYQEATGKAYFIDDNNVGRLKVSFFGPFYGGYNVIALDQDNYSWSLISGPNRKYLWILAREPTLAPDIVDRLVNLATEYGYATDALIFVDQTANKSLSAE